MKIAVIEHLLSGDAQDDARSLGEAARKASTAGAEAVFFPSVLPSDDAMSELVSVLDVLPGTHVVPRVAADKPARVFETSQEVPLADRLGPIAMLVGDACVDEENFAQVAESGASVLVMFPRAESELQAEAFLEVAVALSESAAGLVIIAEGVGAELGEAGHGGSAIVLLGEILAEAVGSDGDVLVADVPEPVPAPSARDALPALPTILAQRKANHEGRKPDVSYPADLS